MIRQLKTYRRYILPPLLQKGLVLNAEQRCLPRVYCHSSPLCPLVQSSRIRSDHLNLQPRQNHYRHQIYYPRLRTCTRCRRRHRREWSDSFLLLLFS